MKKARSTVLSPVRRLVRSSLILSPSISGKLISLSDRHSNFVQPKREAEDVPPRELWENYAFTEEAYLESGQRDVAAVLDAVEPFLAEWPRVVLDFGCASARMLRFFPAEKDSELWGVDINAEHVSWCQRHLPRLNFATTSTAPHLPFEDAYFDLVYAASVFTHISDLADAWLLELRRVMRKGAIGYVTVHDTITYRQLFTKYALDPLFSPLVEEARRFEQSHQALERDYDMFWFGADPYSQVFYDRPFLEAKWGKWLRLLAYKPQIDGHQSASVLQKP